MGNSKKKINEIGKKRQNAKLELHLTRPLALSHAISTFIYIYINIDVKLHSYMYTKQESLQLHETQYGWVINSFTCCK